MKNHFKGCNKERDVNEKKEYKNCIKFTDFKSKFC